MPLGGALLPKVFLPLDGSPKLWNCIWSTLRRGNDLCGFILSFGVPGMLDGLRRPSKPPYKELNELSVYALGVRLVRQKACPG